MPRKNELLVTHLVLLKCIKDNPGVAKSKLWTPSGGLWNKALQPLIDAGYCRKVSSAHRYTDALQLLRLAKLIELKVPYLVTKASETLFLTLAKSPRKWPLVIPLNEDGSRNWDKAEYYVPQ